MKNLISIWSEQVARLEIVNSRNDYNSLLMKLSNPDKPIVLGFLNAHALNMLAENMLFADSVSKMNVALRDGAGVKILLQILKNKSGLNMNGTDFIPDILGLFRGRNVALLGTEDLYLKKAAKMIEKEYEVKSDVIENGFHDTEFYLNMLNEKPVDLVILGMGMPKQEVIARNLKNNLNYPCLIVCGGAIFDFMAGRFSRAPGWLRSMGMEWLFRFMIEPKRLFHRYMIGNPKFLMRAMILKMFS